MLREALRLVAVAWTFVWRKEEPTEADLVWRKVEARRIGYIYEGRYFHCDSDYVWRRWNGKEWEHKYYDPTEDERYDIY